MTLARAFALFTMIASNTALAEPPRPAVLSVKHASQICEEIIGGSVILPDGEFLVDDLRDTQGNGSIELFSYDNRTFLAGNIEATVTKLASGTNKLFIDRYYVAPHYRNLKFSSVILAKTVQIVEQVSEIGADLAHTNFAAIDNFMKEHGYRYRDLLKWRNASFNEPPEALLEEAIWSTPFGKTMRKLGMKHVKDITKKLHERPEQIGVVFFAAGAKNSL